MDSARLWMLLAAFATRFAHITRKAVSKYRADGVDVTLEMERN